MTELHKIENSAGGTVFSSYICAVNPITQRTSVATAGTAFAGWKSIVEYSIHNSLSWGYDALGQVIVRREYDPFGPNAVDFAYRFSTKPRDPATGLYYYGYRWYDPYAGRWINKDPIEGSDGVNLYRFVGNHGIGLADRLGLDTYGMKIVGKNQAMEYDAMAKTFAFFLTDPITDWKLRNFNFGRLTPPSGLADVNKKDHHERLILCTGVTNGRESRSVKYPAKPNQGIYTNGKEDEKGKAELWEVDLTQTVEITIDTNTGVITAKEFGANEWDWKGVGPDAGLKDVIALGSILVVNLPAHKHKATFDCYGVGGWDPNSSWTYRKGPLTGQDHAEGKPAGAIAVGTGFKPNGLTGAEYPDVTIIGDYPQDGQRMKGGRVDARKHGFLPKVSLGVECAVKK